MIITLAWPVFFQVRPIDPVYIAQDVDRFLQGRHQAAVVFDFGGL